MVSPGAGFTQEPQFWERPRWKAPGFEDVLITQWPRCFPGLLTSIWAECPCAFSSDNEATERSAAGHRKRRRVLNKHRQFNQPWRNPRVDWKCFVRARREASALRERRGRLEVTSLTAEAAMVQMSMGRLKKKKKKTRRLRERKREWERGRERGSLYLGIFQRTRQTNVPWKEDKNILAQ